ncbi:MAG: phage portal protein, partial [Pseudonocardiaceae bacterium]
ERARKIVLREEDPHEGPIIKPAKLDREQKRILRVLNRRANDLEIAAVFRHRLVAQFLLSSRGVFVEAVRTRRGGIHSLYLLDPDRVEPVPGRRKTNPDDPHEVEAIVPIESFRITTAAPGAPHWDYRPPFDPDADPEQQPSGIVWLRSPHPTMFERGMSPMEAAGLSADLDRYARLYNRRFMQEDGRPGGILSVKGPIDPQYEEVLANRFRGGPDVSNSRTAVIEADDIAWVDTSGHPRDTQWGDTMDRTKREICVAFGLPESVVSDSSGETFDNSDADYAKAWEHCLLNVFRLLDAQLDVLTPGGYGDDTFLSHDVSDVWVLGRHQRARQDRAAADLERGAITIDEYREICDLEPFDVPASRVLWIPAGRLAVADGDGAHDG